MKQSEFLNKFLSPTQELLISTILSFSANAFKNKKMLLVQGGYAVDLAYGKQTREHDDLDFIILEKDLTTFKNFMQEQDYKVDTKDPKGLSFFAINNVTKLHVDFDSIQIDNNTDEVSDYDEPYRYVWPIKASELIQETLLNNIKIQYVNPKLVKEFKKMQIQNKGVTRDKELHDFKILDEVISSNFG